MKRLRKTLSLLLALFMLLSNIGPAFASQGLADETSEILEQSVDEEIPESDLVESEKPEAGQDNQKENSANPNIETESKEQTISEIEESQPPIVKSKDVGFEQGFDEKIDLKIRVKLIGLAGEEFSFYQIFPQRAELDFVYMDKDSHTEQRITRRFSDKENEIDFASFYPEEIKNGRLELKTDGSNLLLVDQDKDLSSYDPKKDFTYEIYQLPNTRVNFKTFDTEGKQVANPNYGKFTYQVKGKTLENLDLGGDLTKPLIETWDLKDCQNSQDSLAKVSLEENIEDENFTYEIIKESHEEDDFTKPFEVSLIRKPKISDSKNKDQENQELDKKDIKDQVDNGKEDIEIEKEPEKIDQIMDLRSQILGEKDQTREENSSEKKTKIKEKKLANLEISSQPEVNRQMAGGDEEKPGFNETKFVVKINLHPLYGKEKFDFNKIFPDGLMVYAEGSYDVYFKDIENGQSVIKHLVEKNYYDEIEFSPDNPVVDFGIVSQLLFFSSFKRIDELKEFPKGESEILVDYDAPAYRLLETISAPTVPRYDDYPTTIIEVNMYQTHNTEIIVKTIDENKDSISNPTGKLTHTIGNENRTVSIPSNSDPTDTFGDLAIYDGNGGNYKNFNGSKESRVSLDGADANGFLVEGGYAYKIIEKKQDDKAEPLEVTIQKKPLVRTENPNDTDYVKVDFLAGDHGSINENKTYWVLKGVDLGNRLSPPEVSPEKNYKFKNWNPVFPTSNQSFDQDTSFTAQYEEDKEPGYGENDAFVKLTTHGLKGKDFPFSTIFPQGYKIDLEYLDFDTLEVELLGSKTFTKDDEIYYGNFEQYKLQDAALNELTDPSGGVRIIRTTGKREKGEKGYSIFPHDIYLVQNTNAIFKTIDKDGNPVDNPKSGKVSYKLGVKNKKNQVIPQNNESTDMLAGERFNSDEWKGNYDGSQMPTVSLYNAPNGFIVEGVYAYKILKQEQENDDKANPLEVTLIRKQIVVESADQPKTKDADGNETPDNDYVKVTFDGGDHGSIKENKTYWVLKGLNVSGKITGPEVTEDGTYLFTSWNPEIQTSYTENTTHIAQYSENVPTGLTDSGYAIPVVLLVFGILMTFVSLINIRKKSPYD